MDKNLKLLNEFANGNSVAIGGDIAVEITSHSTGMKPKWGGTMKYEDCEYLSSIIKGAQAFIYYLERKGWEIKRRGK